MRHELMYHHLRHVSTSCKQYPLFGSYHHHDFDLVNPITIGILMMSTFLLQRIQHLKKKFYFHFQDYIDLIMWKVLDSTLTFLVTLTSLLLKKICLSHVLCKCSPFLYFGYFVILLIFEVWYWNNLPFQFFEQVQFLDRHHLLIKFGSVDGGVSTSYIYASLISKSCILSSRFSHVYDVLSFDCY